jgi:hypothetical protein
MRRDPDTARALPVDLLTPAGERHDKRLCIQGQLADLLRGLESVHVRQPDIHEDQLRPEGLDQLDRCWPIAGLAYLVAHDIQQRAE